MGNFIADVLDSFKDNKSNEKKNLFMKKLKIYVQIFQFINLLGEYYEMPFLWKR